MKDKIIKELVSLWYSLLIDHHKDRDCHFYINIDYCYDGKVNCDISHYGYVAEEWRTHCESIETAKNILIEKLIKQIKKEAEFMATADDRIDELDDTIDKCHETGKEVLKKLKKYE